MVQCADTVRQPEPAASMPCATGGWEPFAACSAVPGKISRTAGLLLSLAQTVKDWHVEARQSARLGARVGWKEAQHIVRDTEC